MDNARPCKIKPRKRAYFILIACTGNQVRKTEYDTPCQRMEYKIKIPIVIYFLHLATHKNFRFLPIHIKFIDSATRTCKRKSPDLLTWSQHLPLLSLLLKCN